MALSSVIDIIAIGIVLLATLISTIRGFVRSFISIFGTIISLILAILLSSLVVGFLESKFSCVTYMGGVVRPSLTKFFGEGIMNTTVAEATEQSLLDGGISLWLVKIILSLKGSASLTPDKTVSNVICSTFGYYIVLILSIIALFIIFKIIFFILKDISKGLRRIKLIGATDRILGFLLGVVHGAIIVSIIIFIINIIPIEFFQKISLEITKAPFANFINNINIFSYIINSLFNPARFI